MNRSLSGGIANAVMTDVIQYGPRLALAPPTIPGDSLARLLRIGGSTSAQRMDLDGWIHTPFGIHVPSITGKLERADPPAFCRQPRPHRRRLVDRKMVHGKIDKMDTMRRPPPRSSHEEGELTGSNPHSQNHGIGLPPIQGLRYHAGLKPQLGSQDHLYSSFRSPIHPRDVIRSKPRLISSISLDLFFRGQSPDHRIFFLPPSPDRLLSNKILGDKSSPGVSRPELHSSMALSGIEASPIQPTGNTQGSAMPIDKTAEQAQQ